MNTNLQSSVKIKPNRTLNNHKMNSPNLSALLDPVQQLSVSKSGLIKSVFQNAYGGTFSRKPHSALTNSEST